MISSEYVAGRIFMGRLEKGADLLDSLNRMALEAGVRAGRVEALGAVERARLGFYDQRRQLYTYYEMDGGLEILTLGGNLSVKDGVPFVHAHAVLCDASGQAVGGHLAQGTVIYSCEFIIQEFSGPEKVRSLDEATGLQLWK